MSGVVLPFEPVMTVDEAWERYRVLAKKAQDDPSLATDRQFMEELRRAHKRWTDLFDKSEAGR
jgi:hypothetical protein